jgi:hypothetical protein
MFTSLGLSLIVILSQNHDQPWIESVSLINFREIESERMSQITNIHKMLVAYIKNAGNKSEVWKTGE